MIHGITHDDKLVKTKVNFLADYFAFAATQKGKCDHVGVDNPLSLVDKSIFQIENNPAFCPIYVASYLSHPLLRYRNEFSNKFTTFKEFKRLFQEFNRQSNQSTWIKDNPDFLKMLKDFREELEQSMFKNALDKVVHMLLCNCQLGQHKEEFIYLTNILVSEFIFNARSTQDVRKLFTNLLGKEIAKFPFPVELKDKDVEAKREFLENRTFQQQFEGILNSFREQPKNNYLLFKVVNIVTYTSFKFEYEKVTFFCPSHCELMELMSVTNDHYTDLFKDAGAIAAFRVEYYSNEIAEREAIKEINKALQFINIRLNIKASLEPNKYALTNDFKTFTGYSGDTRTDNFELDDKDFDKLQDNPFVLLNGIASISKDKFLRAEPVFNEGLETKNSARFWQYLELIIPNKVLTNNSQTKQILACVPKILLLNTESYYRNHIMWNYICDSVNAMNFNAKALGTTIQDQLQFFREEGKEIEKIKSAIKHPFVSHLIKEHERKFTTRDLILQERHYCRILIEAKAQRNAEIHNGTTDRKGIITLEHTILTLIFRLRWLLMEQMQKEDGKPYEEIFYSLVDKADQLIQPNKNGGN